MPSTSSAGRSPGFASWKDSTSLPPPSPLGLGRNDQAQAERLLDFLSALTRGTDWRDPGLDVDLAQVAALVAQLDDAASDEFIRFEQQCMDENADRARIHAHLH